MSSYKKDQKTNASISILPDHLQKYIKGHGLKDTLTGMD
jgi:hypothetical protein